MIRTFRRTWQTRKTNARNKDGVRIRKLVGEPTKEVVYHVPSLDADSGTTEQVKRDLWEHPSKLVRIMLKGGFL